MQTDTVTKTRQLSPLLSFLGEDAEVLGREKIPVNNAIICESLEVMLPDIGQADDKGILCLYPIDDNKYCLQLYFQINGETSGSNSKVISLRYLPAFFDQYPPEVMMANQPFRFDQTSDIQFPVCSQSRLLIDKLLEETKLPPFIGSLQQSETAIQLLGKALECISVPFTNCQTPTCRFLAFESECDKIHDARRILDNNIDQLFTIRELARKVAMNECYLKKGFKAMIGKTIHDYQQELRIERAKKLLKQDGISVTDVANTLGYSSISHFSTAFKRITGMKPCELLA